MKKNVMLRGIKLISIFVLMLATSGVYAYNDIQIKKVSNRAATDSIEVVNLKKDEEEVVQEEVNEVVEEENTSQRVSTVPVVANETLISGNTIRVGGVLYNHLMYDTNADNFYLNHDLNGNYDGRGVPYVDFRNDFTGRKTIVYSHSSTYGNGPFQALQNYHNNPGFYSGNRYITIQYDGNVYTYEIFSVYVSLADNEESEGLEYFRNMDYSNSEWAETIQRYKNNSEYDTGVSVSASDKIIILQTCSMDPNYYEKYYRYNLLIMGKLV